MRKGNLNPKLVNILRVSAGPTAKNRHLPPRSVSGGHIRVGGCRSVPGSAPLATRLPARSIMLPGHFAPLGGRTPRQPKRLPSSQTDGMPYGDQRQEGAIVRYRWPIIYLLGFCVVAVPCTARSVIIDIDALSN